jgi:hypothetical protein
VIGLAYRSVMILLFGDALRARQRSSDQPFRGD